MSSETPPVPDTFSDDCRNFIQICLRRDPEERLASSLCCSMLELPFGPALCFHEGGC